MAFIKYVPTEEELLDIFKKLYLKPEELNELLIINLTKYHMLDKLEYFKEEIKKHKNEN